MSKRSTIKVTISGPAKSGKSGIARVITNTLQGLMADATVVLRDEYIRSVYEAYPIVINLNVVVDVEVTN